MTFYFIFAGEQFRKSVACSTQYTQIINNHKKKISRDLKNNIR